MSANTQIKITGEPTMNPDVYKFIVDHPGFIEGSFNFRNKEMAKDSPLPEALFKIKGIKSVLVAGNVLTISKSNSDSWVELGKKIGASVREVIATGKKLITDDLKSKLPTEEKIRKEIEKIFAEEINPNISSHGGMAELTRVEGTKVYVRLSGGCQGCASANVTLKSGIEKAIRAKLPEITEVLDDTDHDSGTNPYYS